MISSCCTKHYLTFSRWAGLAAFADSVKHCPSLLHLLPAISVVPNTAHSQSVLFMPGMPLHVVTPSRRMSTADEFDRDRCVGQALPPRYGNQHHASTGVAQSSGLHGAQPGGAATLPHASSGSLSAPSAQSAPQLPQVRHCSSLH